MHSYLEQIISQELPLIHYDLFDEIPFIQCGFTTRIGGVSKGVCKSMNLSFTRGDAEEDVRKNYEILAKHLGCQVEDFVASLQTHTTNIRVVTKEDKGKGIVRERDYTDIDGLMTKEENIFLFTYYADCVPLFFADPVKRVVATSHSGWRGTAEKMGAVTIEKMVSEFECKTEDILVAIGPSICKDCYEVSEDVILEFEKNFRKEEVQEIASHGKPGKYQLDLWKANEIILKNAGIPDEHIENRRICTCCNKEILFSHRGSQGKRGNLAGFIGIVS